MSADIFEDIPAPRTAVYVDHDNTSFSYRTETFRCGRFLFEYQGSDANVVDFYKRVMSAPPYSWKLLKEDSAAAGSTTLIFAKNDDRCMVDVDSVPKPSAARQHNVEITIRVNYRR